MEDGGDGVFSQDLAPSVQVGVTFGGEVFGAQSVAVGFLPLVNLIHVLLEISEILSRLDQPCPDHILVFRENVNDDPQLFMATSGRTSIDDANRHAGLVPHGFDS